jgi:hypothetical protein
MAANVYIASLKGIAETWKNREVKIGQIKMKVGNIYVESRHV